MDSSSRQSSNRPVFTQEMRDRQARGKDPYRTEEEEREDEAYRLGGYRFEQENEEKESAAELERRGAIMAILDHPEHLMASAMSNGNSIPRERTRLLAMLCGFDKKNEDEVQASGSGSRKGQDRRSGQK
ncbi:hypothetical protein BGZ63DRAFT_209815 [Mariannaea sp. PMI_226]|nr:hypothetical protein BGZ63DRAFT_209815 [Mariannaea sp. PMI_226]